LLSLLRRGERLDAASIDLIPIPLLGRMDKLLATNDNRTDEGKVLASMEKRVSGKCHEVRNLLDRLASILEAKAFSSSQPFLERIQRLKENQEINIVAACDKDEQQTKQR
jgi:hypothetical protein